MTSTLAPLRVDVAARGDIRVVTLAGRLDQTFEELLARTFAKLVEQEQVRVIVDLRDLNFLNSRGVSAFIAAVDELRGAGGDLKLAGAPAQSRLVLERLGVDQILQQFDSVDQAVDAFQVPIQDFLSQGGLDVFVAGPRGKTFHSSSCSKAKNLKMVRILTSKKAAREAGLRPCRRCAAD
jgi:anti-sigma B factor antagonist